MLPSLDMYITHTHTAPGPSPHGLLDLCSYSVLEEYFFNMGELILLGWDRRSDGDILKASTANLLSTSYTFFFVPTVLVTRNAI